MQKVEIRCINCLPRQLLVTNGSGKYRSGFREKANSTPKLSAPRLCLRSVFRQILSPNRWSYLNSPCQNVTFLPQPIWFTAPSSRTVLCFATTSRRSPQTKKFPKSNINGRIPGTLIWPRNVLDVRQLLPFKCVFVACFARWLCTPAGREFTKVSARAAHVDRLDWGSPSEYHRVWRSLMSGFKARSAEVLGTHST